MTVGVQKAKSAVRLLMRELPPDSLWALDDRAIHRCAGIDVDVALGGFSRDIADGDPDERLIAVEALVWIGDPRATSPLIRALRDPLWHVRLAAANGLAHWSPFPRLAVEPLSTAVGDPEPAVRAAAAETLGGTNSVAVLPVLISALDDSSRSVRLAAAWALDRLGASEITSRWGAARLARTLKEEHDPWVVYAAYWALGAQGGRLTEPERSEFRRSDRGRRMWDTVAPR